MGQNCIYSSFTSWREHAIKTKYGILLAQEDFVVIDEKGRHKRYFSWAEAMELDKRVLRPKGWRLPTKGEWERIVEGMSSPEELKTEFNFNMNGFVSWKDMGIYDQTIDNRYVHYQNGCGCFWSSSSADFPYKYNLFFDSANMNPSKCNYLGYGYSIRCVAL